MNLRWKATPNGQFWLLHAGSLEPAVADLQRQRNGWWAPRFFLGEVGPWDEPGGCDAEDVKRRVEEAVRNWLIAATL